MSHAESSKAAQEGDVDASAKLLTGAAWADAGFGFLLSLVSFTLLTLVLFNPIAASMLLVFHLDKPFPSQARLLAGWSVALGFQFVFRAFVLRHCFQVLGFSILWAGLSAASLWLLIILAAWWLLGS